MSLLTLPSLAWTPSPNCSSRRGQRGRLIVVHDCEGSFAGSVSWFATAKSQVSAHVVLSEDGLSAVQMVAWSAKAWHACDVNSFSEGVEAAGFAAKGLGAAEWDALAAIVAFRLRANGVPCQIATAANDWTGFCQHADLGAMGGGHHDITHDGAVWANFVGLVRARSAADMPTSWTPAGLAPAPARPAGWTPHSAIRHDLPVGSIGWTQAALNAIGAPASPLAVDGVEGAATRAAIESFQAQARIGVDGAAGPQTVAALEKALASASAVRPGA